MDFIPMNFAGGKILFVGNGFSLITRRDKRKVFLWEKAV